MSLIRLVFGLGLLFLVACAGPAYSPRPVETPVRPTPSSPPESVRPPAETRAPGVMKPWERPYEVFGERYEPLRGDAHAGFVEEGLASWYGKDFHGRKTSNGEIYDMHGRTAAHKTLPLGVHVKVKNLANGKEAICRINDRGPFVRGRIIDLSYTLAQELEVVGPGTAPVRVEVLGFRESDVAGRPVYRQLRSYDQGSYTVQVGSFGVRDNADRLATQLQARHGAASVKEGWVGERLFYRVRAGNYSSLDAAEAARRSFEAGGYPSSFVVAME
ncbi:MAG: septal ring lytic transglycosylase RlpA family protein [Desulfuromonadales bacterium]|nr:septal ring lytic transglycosylase RlpA family protein [Desulfuromonadales bacterium]